MCEDNEGEGDVDEGEDDVDVNVDVQSDDGKEESEEDEDTQHASAPEEESSSSSAYLLQNFLVQSTIIFGTMGTYLYWDAAHVVHITYYFFYMKKHNFEIYDFFQQNSHTRTRENSLLWTRYLPTLWLLFFLYAKFKVPFILVVHNTWTDLFHVYRIIIRYRSSFDFIQ